MSTESTPVFLQHNRVRLALHTLSSEAGRPLLLLHGLGERSPKTVPPELLDWPGPVYALDFTGHGQSTIPTGGGYTCELLMADVDTVLNKLQAATLVGRGLGAYVSLLIAGSRPDRVRGAILRDGPGLAGGGAASSSPYIPFVDPARKGPPDPYALVELATDIRPRDYAAMFARQAAQFSGMSQPLLVCARERPPWLGAVMTELDIELTTLQQSLMWYAESNE
ncbi:MAG: alpha/beta hydrolase [Polyangiales bacterium]